MSLTGMSALISSARAQQLAAQIIANNIANAATPGYSRQIPGLATTSPTDFAVMGSTTRAQLGTGVKLYTVNRARDEYLDVQLRQETAMLGQQNALSSAMNAMKTLFPELNATPGEGFITYVDRMFADFTAVGAAPGSAAARQTLVTDAQTMTGLLNGANRLLTDLRTQFNSRVEANITRINSLIGQVAVANNFISNATTGGGTANDTMDKRDIALNELAKLIRIDTVKMTDGSVMVTTGNSRVLVSGDKVARLVSVANSHDGLTGVGISKPAGLAVNTAALGMFIGTPTFKTVDISGEIRGGEILGNIIARDQVIADEKLELDQLASSLIDQTNLLHQAGYAQDGTTTNIAFFTGTKAGDISVNTTVAGNLTLVAASRIAGNGANGEQADSIGYLSDMVMNAMVQSGSRIDNIVGFIDPTQALNAAAHTALNGPNPFSRNLSDFSVVPNAAGTIVINGASIAWTNADSINTIIGKINNPALGIGVRASFDWTTQRVSILSKGPVTIYDSAGNLTAFLNLQTKATSLAAMNNGIGPADNAISAGTAVSASDRQYRTLAGVGGSIDINGTGYGWTESQTLTSIRAGINAAIVAQQLSFSFSAATQKMTVVGTRPAGTAATAANPIKSVVMTDKTGNLSMVMNMEAQPTFDAYREAMLAQMQAQEDGTTAMQEQSQGMVDQLQAQQDAIMKVNVDEERMKLTEYARAYEAAIRAMGVLDEMLNVLINRMAVTSSGGTSSALNP